MCLYVHVECPYVVNAYTCLGGGIFHYSTICNYQMLHSSYMGEKYLQVYQCLIVLSKWQEHFLLISLKLMVSAKLSQARF